MGQAKARRAAFFSLHPVCAFCGGGADATTIEHCPPRSLFQNRVWPAGFEFPACESCNGGSSDDDLLVALSARAAAGSGNDDGRFRGLMFNANRQFPGLVRRMLPSATEARRLNRRFGISPGPGETHQDVSPVKLPDEVRRAVERVCAKLGKAVYYMESGRVFPKDGCLMLQWETNTPGDGTFKLLDALADAPGKVVTLERCGQALSDQFQLKVGKTEGFEVFAVQAIFYAAYFAVIFGSPERGRLERMVGEVQQRLGTAMRFKVLQSPEPPADQALQR